MGEDRRCVYNITLRCVCVISIPRRLSQQPDTISCETSVFVTMECCQQEQDICRSSCKVSDIFV